MATTFIDTTPDDQIAMAKAAFDAYQAVVGGSAVFTWFGQPWVPDSPPALIGYSDDPSAPPTVTYVGPTNPALLATQQSQATIAAANLTAQAAVARELATPADVQKKTLWIAALVLLIFWLMRQPTQS